MYVDEHPLSLNLDIDRIRDLIGRWNDDPHTAGLLARAIALSAARAHLAGGYDVVIPQFLGRADFLEQVEQVAQDIGADFHEIVLLDRKANALSRFAERSRAAVNSEHIQAQEMLDRDGGVEQLGAWYDRLVALIAGRPRAKVIPTNAGQIEQSYRLFVDSLS
jgi:hypothetical protein